jgi:hypothetical protein
VLPSRPALPDFFQRNKAFGTIVATNVRGGPEVAAAVGNLLPTSRGVTPVGLDRIESAIGRDVGSFLDRGRKFPVKVGGEWFEARVRAVVETPAADPKAPPVGTRIDTTVQSGTSVGGNVEITKANSVGLGALATAGVGPMGFAHGRAQLAAPTVANSSSTSATDQRQIRSSGNSTDVDVPIRFEITLTGGDGRSATGAVVDGGATLHVPDDLSDTTPLDGQPVVRPEDPAWGRKLEHPVPEALVDFDAETAFREIAARFPDSVTKLGAPGRTDLQNFLNPTTLTNELGRLLDGGTVLSPDLVSPHGSVRNAVQVTAELVDAQLVGVPGSPELRLHDVATSSTGQSAATKSGFDLNVGFGGGAVGSFSGTDGAPTGGYGAVTGGVSSRTTETSQAGTTTTSRRGVQVKGEAGLYRTTTRLTFTTPTGTPLTYDAVSYLRVGLPEAKQRGLGVPDGTPDLFTQVERRYEPPYLAASLAAGDAKVGEFEAAAKVQGQVETALRGVKGLEDLLPTWSDADAPARKSGRDAADAAERLANQRALSAALSPSALKAKMDTLLGPGVQVQLKQQGLFTDEFVNVTVRAKTGPGRHLGRADKRNVRSGGATSPSLTSSTTTQKTGRIGAEGRVVIPKPLAKVTLAPSPNVGGQFSTTKTTKNSAGPTTAATTLNTGTPDSQVFEHDVEFEVVITRYTRNRPWVRRLTPDSPIRRAPKVETLFTSSPDLPDGHPGRAISGSMNLYTSSGVTSTTDLSAFAPEKPTRRDLAPGETPTVKDLLTRESPQVGPKPKWLGVEAVAYTTALRDEAVTKLEEAAGKDSVLGLPGSDARRRVDAMFEPEALRANLRKLVDQGVQEGGMKYDRRIADRVGEIGMTMSLRDAKIVAVAEDGVVESATSGGSKSSATTTDTKAVELNANLGVPVRPSTAAAGAGGAAVSGRWTPWQESSVREDEIAASVDRNYKTSPKGRTFLVQMTADATIVAESRNTNLLHDSTPKRAGAVVTLPGGVFLRVGEEQAREMGLLPKLPERAASPDVSVAPPSSVRPGQPSSLGLGVVEDLPDTAGLVADLRAQLGDRGAKLMPDSVLDDSMNNLRRLLDLTSPESRKGLLDSALDGGVPLLLHDPGVFGNDTYQVTLHAKAGTPVFRDVVNDGVEIEHVVTGVDKETESRGKGSSWSVGLRVPGTAVVPSSSDPNLTGTAGAMAVVNVGQANSINDSHSTADQSGRVRKANGPAARFDVPVEFELVVRKGDQVLATASTAKPGEPPKTVLLRTLADNQRITRAAPAVPAPVPPPVPRVRDAGEGAPENVRAWQEAGHGTLPYHASIEGLHGAGAVRDAAVTALKEAGAKRGLTDPNTGAGNALWSALSTEMLEAKLPAMLTGSLDLPELHEAALLMSQHADVKVYARLVDPELAGLSDGVELERPESSVSGTSTEAKQTDTGGAGVGLGSGGLAHKQPDANFSTGGVEVRRTGEDGAATSTGATDSKVNTLKPKGRSGLAGFGVEYRVVADLGKGRTAVVDVSVPASTRARMTAPEVETLLGAPLDQDLLAAQQRVKDAAAEWRTAEEDLDAAQRKADDAWRDVHERADRAEARVRERQFALDRAGDRAETADSAVERLREPAREAREHADRLAEERTRLEEAAELADARAETTAGEVAALDRTVTEAGTLAGELAEDQRQVRKARDEAVEGGATNTATTDELLERIGRELTEAETARDEAAAALPEAREEAEKAAEEAREAAERVDEATREAREAEAAATRAEEVLRAAERRQDGADRVLDDASREHARAGEHHRALTAELDARTAEAALLRAEADAKKADWLREKAALDERMDEYNARRHDDRSTSPDPATGSTDASSTPTGDTGTARQDAAEQRGTDRAVAEIDTVPDVTKPGPTQRGGGDGVPLVEGLTAADVDFRPLTDASGRVVGVAFPSRAGDEAAMGTTTATTATEYRRYRDTAASTGGGGVEGVDFDVVDTPWGRDGRTPFHVDSHGHPDGFDVRLTNGEVVRISGTAMADLVRGTNLMREAGTSADAPVVAWSCEVGTSRTGPAHDLAKRLRATGHTGEVYAAPAVTTIDPSGGWVGVDGGRDFERFDEDPAAGPARLDLGFTPGTFAQELLATLDAITADSALRLPDAPPRLSLGFTPDTFVEELFDALDTNPATAPENSPAGRASSRTSEWTSPSARQVGGDYTRASEDWNSSRPHAETVTAQDLEQNLGLPRKNQRRFQALVDRFGLVLDVRPTNPAAVRRLDEGAVPKPEDVKAKTITRWDTFIGASSADVGLVGFFAPTLPPSAELAAMSPEDRTAVETAFAKRRREHSELAEEMRRLTEEGRFDVDERGVVRARTADGGFREVTGDHDLFHIRLPQDGASLSQEDYDAVVWLLTHRNAGVRHGAHVYWSPAGDFQHAIYEDVVARHRAGSASNEPLIRFSPGDPPALVYADEPARDDRDPGSGTAAAADAAEEAARAVRTATATYRRAAVDRAHAEIDLFATRRAGGDVDAALERLTLARKDAGAALAALVRAGEPAGEDDPPVPLLPVQDPVEQAGRVERAAAARERLDRATALLARRDRELTERQERMGDAADVHAEADSALRAVNARLRAVADELHALVRDVERIARAVRRQDEEVDAARRSGDGTRIAAATAREATLVRERDRLEAEVEGLEAEAARLREEQAELGGDTRGALHRFERARRDRDEARTAREEAATEVLEAQAALPPAGRSLIDRSGRAAGTLLPPGTGFAPRTGER